MACSTNQPVRRILSTNPHYRFVGFVCLYRWYTVPEGDVLARRSIGRVRIRVAPVGFLVLVKQNLTKIGYIRRDLARLPNQ